VRNPEPVQAPSRQQVQIRTARPGHEQRRYSLHPASHPWWKRLHTFPASEVLSGMRVLSCGLLAVGFCVAQSTVEFEVISVKPSVTAGNPGLRLDGSQFVSSGIPIRNLMYTAFNIQTWQLMGGPGWIDSESYDIVAKLPAGTNQEQLNRMMLSVLADRFKLSVHRETRDYPIYRLVVAKNGSKLKDSTAERTRAIVGKGHLSIQHASLPIFASYLSGGHVADRPVIDATEIKGNYDFSLDWTPEDSPQDGGASAPSIFTALQEQLGLRLEANKSPFEFIVIDHIERPSSN
jgi:uncharacterized protein (TIGR03435 family)